MKRKYVLLLVLVLLGAVVFWYARPWLGLPVVTEIERGFTRHLLLDADGNTLESTYAENITFANAFVRPDPGNEDGLLIDLDVTNNGDKTVTELYVYVDFYNRDGRQASACTAHLGINSAINDAPIPSKSTKRVTIAPYRKGWNGDPKHVWTGGKMVVRIRIFETE